MAEGGWLKVAQVAKDSNGGGPMRMKSLLGWSNEHQDAKIHAHEFGLGGCLGVCKAICSFFSFLTLTLGS